MGKKKRVRRILLGIFMILILGAIVLIGLIIAAPEPPVTAITEAQTALSRARQAEAEKYASPVLAEAQSTYESANREWKYQNERLFFLRNYEMVIELANQASEKAQEAEKLSLQVRGSLQNDLSVLLTRVGKMVTSFEKDYAQLPLDKRFRQDFTSARLLYVECLRSYERKEYKGVREKLVKADQLISGSVGKAHGYLEDYFLSLPDWKKWAQETITWSKDNYAPAIVVDKFDRKCRVYDNGRLQKEFEIELGPNWIGDKEYRGDGATPEGKYRVTKKKRGRETKYYKALLINYPNEEDIIQYEENVRKGLVPKKGIGGLIEIHGDGGRGINWTDGCIALSNDDMDRLYNMTAVGTPVTIVGSLRSLNEINGY